MLREAPIIQEVRKAGDKLAKQANYDLHTFFQNLRENQKKRKPKIISRIKQKKASYNLSHTP